VLQEGQEGVVGPVQILEHEHTGAALGQGFQEPTPGGEVLLPGRGGSLQPDQGSQTLAEPWGVGMGLRDDGVDLDPGHVEGIGLEDPRLRLDDLPQGPEGDGVSIGQAPPLAPTDEVGPVLDV